MLVAAVVVALSLGCGGSGSGGGAHQDSASGPGSGTSATWVPFPALCAAPQLASVASATCVAGWSGCTPGEQISVRFDASGQLASVNGTSCTLDKQFTNCAMPCCFGYYHCGAGCTVEANWPNSEGNKVWEISMSGSSCPGGQQGGFDIGAAGTSCVPSGGDCSADRNCCTGVCTWQYFNGAGHYTCLTQSTCEARCMSGSVCCGGAFCSGQCIGNPCCS